MSRFRSPSFRLVIRATLFLAVAAMGVPSAFAGPLVKASDRSFDQKILGAAKPVLVAFGAPWCAPCKRLEQHLEVVARDRADDLLVAKVDASRSEDVAERYAVTKIPTLVLFRDGVEVARGAGIQSRETLERFLDRAVEPVGAFGSIDPPAAGPAVASLARGR